MTPWRPINPTFPADGWLLLNVHSLGEASAEQLITFFIGMEAEWTIENFISKHLWVLKKLMTEEQRNINVEYERGTGGKKSTQFNKCMALVKANKIRCDEGSGSCWMCNVIQN